MISAAPFYERPAPRRGRTVNCSTPPLDAHARRAGSAATVRIDTEVDSGEKRQFRFEVSKTYLGDPVEIPVTVINGEADGPRVCLTAALHGDELNGVKVLQEVADRYRPSDVHGTLVCLHVVNVPAIRPKSGISPATIRTSTARSRGRNARTRPNGWPTRCTSGS
jgi:predicted deacylase